VKNRNAMIVLALVSSVALSGCGTFNGQFKNVPVCAIGEQKAYVISMYGPVGVGSKLTDASARVICASDTTRPIPAAAGNRK